MTEKARRVLNGLVRALVTGHREWLGGAYFYDLGSILATIALVGVLLAVAGLAYDKYTSTQVIAAVEQMRDNAEANVDRLKRDGEPNYKIRFAEVQLEAARRLLNSAKAEEKVLLDKKGETATKEALISLLKGTLFTDVMSAGEVAFDSTLKLSDALGNVESSHQKAVKGKIQDLRRKLEAGGADPGRALSGDDLDFFMAATELEHVGKLLKRDKGIDESDPRYGNVLRQYLKDFYGQKGESPLPANIRKWLDSMIEARYGAPQKAPSDALGRTLTAVGTMKFRIVCPDQRVQDTQMTLRFPSEGGAVDGTATAIIQCTTEPACGPNTLKLTIRFTGQYTKETGRLGGQFRSSAEGDEKVYDSGTCQSQSISASEAGKGAWEATLQDGVVTGRPSPQGWEDLNEALEGFELRVRYE